LRSTLKKFFGVTIILTIPYRVSVTTMTNDICRPWYYCHEYVSFLDTTYNVGASWRVSLNAYPSEHLISPLVFIEVHVVMSFVSPYFMF